jgi:DNA-binding beta-propeller fold protein YncE
MLMRIPTPDRPRSWGSWPRSGLVAAAAVLAAGGAGAAAAAASASDATPAAPAVGTLTALPYTFPAGSGGSLVRPLGISAFQGHVYVSNSSDNVLSDLNAGNTTTIAGSLEASGENGDGGPANLATLWQPTGTATDSAGDIYIADTEDNVVRKIDAATGVITRFAGNGQAGATGPGGRATQTRLDAPQGVAVNADGATRSTRTCRGTPGTPSPEPRRPRPTTGWQRWLATKIGSVRGWSPGR